MRDFANLLLVFLISALPAAAKPTPPADAAVDLLEARALAADSHYEDALKVMDAALAQVPGDPYLHLERAKLLLQLGKLDKASEDAAAARSAAPREPEVLRTQGRIELARADNDPRAARTARDAFEALRTLEPDDLEALVSLGQLYLAANQADLAGEVLDEAARLRPGHPWIESLRARATAAAQDSPAAEKQQRDALASDPSDLGARFELAVRLSRRGANAEAAQLLEDAPSGQRSRFDLRLRLARQLYLAGDLAAAKRTAGELLAERPDDTAPRLVLTRVELALGRYAAAEKLLRPVAAVADSEDAVADLLVRAFEGVGERERAADVLAHRRMAFQAGDQEHLAWATALDLARLRARGGEWKQAAALAAAVAGSGQADLAEPALRLQASALGELGRYDEALEALGAPDPGHPELAALRLDLLLDAGRKQQADLEAKGLLDASPRGPLLLGAVFQGHGMYERARPLLEKALTQDPGSIEANFRLATVYERLGQIDRAIPIFQDLVEKAPFFSPALNYLGYLQIERSQDLDRAVKLVREAVRLEPDNGAYVDSLGWGLFKLGHLDEAVQSLERATRLQPEDATILEHLGDARAATGDSTGARDAYERALAAPGAATEQLKHKLSALSGGA